MSSYQDLDTRVRVLEDKLAFVMHAFSVVTRTPTLLEGHDLVEKKTLLDLYHEQQAGDTGEPGGIIKLN